MPNPKKHKPNRNTRAKVESMCAVGIPQHDISVVLGIDPKTLRKHYREELDSSMTKANAAVAGKLYSSAMSGDVRAQMFWCKTRLGWREYKRQDHTSSDGSMGGITVTFSDSPEELEDSEDD